MRNKQDKTDNEIKDLPSFTQEWAILHNDHEKYERYSLIIKLVNILICFTGLVSGMSFFPVIILLGVVWLQDGIWKTYQSRMSERILLVERYIKEEITTGSNEVAFQFYSEWEKGPRSASALVKEYIRNALRPTVAYPHIILIILQVLFLLF